MRRGTGFRDLPRVTRAGIGIVVLGFGVDLLAHTGWSDGMVIGHLVTIGGMGLSTLGVVGLAVRGPTAGGPGGRRKA